MKRHLSWALLALLSLPAPVSAADGEAEDVPPARIAAGFGAMAHSEKEVYLLRERFHLGAEFSIGRLTLSPFVRMYATSIDLHGKDDLPFSLTISLPWQPVLGTGIEYRLWESRLFFLSLRGEFESPFSENKATLEGYRPDSEFASVPIDGDTLRQHVTVLHLWRGGSASVHAGMILGRIRPRIELGYMSFESSISASFDDTVKPLLDAADVHPDRFYANGASSFYYATGADVHLGDGFALRGSGTVIPVGGEVFVTAELLLIVPIFSP